ncbi:MAG TPA: 8-amino-7-oxononanoate synthase [Pirellulales bacterium]|jgi:8-amino-7-oxononanoate synthase|nr:8-amino-7-oxononanoate synthase [Pirellulales bacterium]
MKFSHHDPLEWIEGELAALAHSGLRRELRAHAGPQQARMMMGGRELTNFGSNDYLGLASDSRLIAAAARAAKEEGWGSGASPLVTGRSTAHQRLEERLAEFLGTPAALAFSSGYAANMSTICALAGRGDSVYADRRNHASLIDGCRLSRAEIHVYPHCDPEGLEDLLRHGAGLRRRLIVTESVFSMGGDLAPLGELADLAEKYDCMLLVDEAHATGVFGSLGRGLAEQLGVERRIPIRIGTLGKALGSAGGFVCGSESLVAWLVNRARGYGFSTAPPPAASAAACAAIEIVRDEPGRRLRLVEASARLRGRLREQGWKVASRASQIIPLVVGDAGQAMRLADHLCAVGLLVPAIRPPSVPEGESMLRISLSSAHTPEMIGQLTAALGAARAAPEYY